MTHVFFLGHHNRRALQLTTDGANLTEDQYNAITRYRLFMRRGADIIEIDSAENPSVFNQEGDGADRRIVIELGFEDLEPGRYPARLVIYAPDKPEGKVFADFRQYLIRMVNGTPD